MASLKHPEPRRMYSWWWDSHISPKNSKWLQENLTDMDAKVKAMIKLIEEDADSFARRAEMYYKKRPELMKLVEEFYRAYRALAERYDNATGVLQQAHRTMAEAFPNQVPLVLGEDSPASSVSETDPHTPEMTPPMRALFDADESLSSSHFHAAKKNGAYTEESDSLTNRKFNDLSGSGDNAKLAEGRVRKGLDFHEAEEKELSIQSKENHIEMVGKLEKEIQTLKEALAKLEADKEAGLDQYQQSLERLSKLQSEVSRAQEDSRGLNERVIKAEGEVQTLREALTKLEAEKESSLLQYQQCLERITNLENTISHTKEQAKECNERAHKTETEAQALKQDLAVTESEKDAALNQYKQSLEMISTLENKLLLAEEDACKLSERVNKAETEVETLKQAITKLTEEKEAAALQYQQCLETISSLEQKISSLQEDAQRLNEEIDSGVDKLKGAKEQCLMLERSNQSLHSELESLVLKTGAQSEELTEKQKELGRLWICVQEERLRFMEAETAFQTLQHLHSQTQEELRSLSSELQNRAKLLSDIETRNQSLHDEVLKMEEKNKSLNELNLSSAMSIKDMQSELLSLREANGKLDSEVELRVDQRNALQQEIYCLKEELNELNKKHQAMLDQVEAVGFSSECIESSVKELQDENSNLKETCERERSEKVALLEKLEIMEQLLEKNVLLEKSLSDLSAELEGTRGKINELDESFRSLLEEKSTLVTENATLITQLQVTTENLEKLSEKNTFLENSLSDAHDELEGLKLRWKSSEDSCQLLENEKCGLITEKDILVSQVEITQQGLEDLEERYRQLEEKYSVLGKEKESTLREVEELRVALDIEKQECASFTLMSEKQLASMENQIRLLQEEVRCRRKDFEEELDKSMKYQLEIFVLQRCVQDLEEKSCSLLIEFQKLLQASKLSERLISELEHENLEQQVEVKSLSDQTSQFRAGMYQLLKAFDIDLDRGCEDKIGQDQKYLKYMLCKLEDTKRSLCQVWDENQQLAVEMSVLVTVLGHLRSEATTIEIERNVLDLEFRIKNEEFSVLQIEASKLRKMNEELQLKVREREQNEELLKTEIENLHGKILDTQEACQNLQNENLKVLEEKRSLTYEFSDLEEEKRILEGENFSVASEMLSLSTLSLIFKNIIIEKSVELKVLGEDLDKLHGVSGALDEKLRMTGGKLEEVQLENFHMKELLKNSEDELRTLTSVSDQLNCEIANNKDLLNQKEIELFEAKLKLSATQNEKLGLQKIVEDLKREHVEVHGKILDMQEACQNLQNENLKVLEEKRSLTNEFSELEEEKRILEGENFSVASEMLSLSTLSLIFKNIIIEKSVELKALGEDLDKLHGVSGALDEKLKMTGGKLEEVQLENFHMKELLKNSEDELRTITSFSDQLNCEIANNKDLLNQKEIELSETEFKLSATQNEKLELQKIVEDLNREHGEVQMVKDDQERQILKLSEDHLHLSKENVCLGEANRELEVELHQLHEEHEKTKSREESLFSEVQKGNSEIDLLMSEATRFFGELQISTVFQALLEAKVHKLTEACKSLEDQTTHKDTGIELLNKRISTLEDENGGLKTQLAAYVPVINSLQDCISSLEKHTCLHRNIQKSNEGVKDADLASDHNIESHEELCADQKVPDEFSELWDLQTRVKAIEKAVIELERQATQESIDTNNKLEAATRQIEELKFRGISNQEYIRPTSEISELENGLLTKDIMLDQVSECSSYGINRREMNSDSHLFESWDTADLDGSIDLTVGKGKKIVTTEHHQVEAVKKQRSKFPSSELLVEKELGVDKLEISRTFSQSRREMNKTKILERLNSDVQKLTNLQITVQDLKKKVEISEKSKKTKDFVESDNLKGQLDVAEETILKLFDLNGKLMKSTEDKSFSADAKAEIGSEESVIVRRRRILEHARRVSDKIGRLQLEVQKIQFVLLKLDDDNEKESKGKLRIRETSRRVLLRDYLYDGMRNRRKKVAFCACVQPPTRE